MPAKVNSQTGMPGTERIKERARLLDTHLVHVCTGCYNVLPSECGRCEDGEDVVYTHYPMEDRVRIGDWT